MKSLLLTLMVVEVFLTSCNQSQTAKVDIEKEKQALLASHQKDRQAHFNTDAASMLENSVDSFIYVGDGSININTKADRIKMVSEYFKDAAYSKWDNMTGPIVRVSDDGTLGWIITKLEVKRTKRDSTGKENPEGFIYAGIMTYKKVNGVWMKDANVSTFEPEKK